jgi:hypothetical protein
MQAIFLAGYRFPRVEESALITQPTETTKLCSKIDFIQGRGGR